MQIDLHHFLAGALAGVGHFHLEADAGGGLGEVPGLGSKGGIAQSKAEGIPHVCAKGGEIPIAHIQALLVFGITAVADGPHHGLADGDHLMVAHPAPIGDLVFVAGIQLEAVGPGPEVL